jgi:hypothetical protein
LIIVEREGEMFHNEGLTTIELAIAVTLMLTIVWGICNMLRGGLDSWVGGGDNLEVTGQGEMAMERLTRELRQAFDEPADTNDIDLSISERVQFYIDGNQDWDLLDAEDKNIEYLKNAGGNLIRTEDGTSNTIATNVTSFTLTRTGNVVDITLTIRKNKGVANLNTQVKLRNY